MSLREEFLEEKSKPRLEIPYGYAGISTALGKFAEQLPDLISSLIKRMRMGETIHEMFEQSLTLEIPFSVSYSWMQPAKEEIDKIPGYQVLLKTAASDDVDVCCKLSVVQKDKHSPSAMFRVTIAPGEPFAKSELQISFGKTPGTFQIGKEDWKPRLDKPKLRLRSPGDS